MPNVELCHHVEECSFDATVRKYELDKKKEPALLELTKIVRGANPPNNKSPTPQSEELAAIAAGFSLISKDDLDNLAKQYFVYDALLA